MVAFMTTKNKILKNVLCTIQIVYIFVHFVEQALQYLICLIRTRIDVFGTEKC